MLVEDNPEFRDVIHLSLEDETDIELTSEFGNAELALRSLNSSAQRKVPDLILLDLNLPGMSGLEALPHFRTALPGAKILILTQSDAEADVLRAISLGASGYLLKSAALHEITNGMHKIMKGGASLDSGVAKFILNTLQKQLPQNDIKKLLSNRELEILTLLSEGLVKKEIAARLQVTYSTVDSHVANLYNKLEVKNAPAAVNMGHRLGLFTAKS
ncbi:Nitrate/nitrite response regulator protein [Lentimonas sp. CC19]|nr:Nitrate/nitrite response regulator protein [Lentimonas sp. CC4]CAA6683924.1 Nitrate/nitrite response regulator protein [Lentimonas sp. CC6]CAA6689976.1 Nitrate/nitrite response regulator protein [Lentimonas sp. CC10]CAA6691052.1 Nitrate/nitrite response regulator protein [Lentimonas sp. CC19]CAA7069334.1 Nitrate/nitrite response regulator protein [Lentimonas sp. CC11]CAA7169968.1 Nitrate/nitrite response regulator protein [Lentimonas sp. CC21]CAA7181257.1 Nitrate/nitrite response regulator